MQYKLDELAAAAGVSARTVRYYVQRGLLPAPAFRGKDTVYDGDHLLRLQAIRRLQEQYLPLDAIQAELTRKETAELETLSSPIPRAAERWARWELAPGVELFASERSGLDEAVVAQLRAVIGRARP